MDPETRSGEEAACQTKTQGQLEAEISQAIMRFEKEYIGRGPDDVRTHIVEDLVLVREKGILTPAEKQLSTTPEGIALIKQVRLRLLENSKALLFEIVQGILGVEPLCLHTDLSTSQGERVIVFSLRGTPQLGAGRRRGG